MYIKRFLEGKIDKYIDKKEIIAIIGPRQSGKTTLLKNILSKLKGGYFIDFEDVEILELFNNDIKSFAELYVKPYNYLFIDEFQYAEKGGKNLKFLYDNYNTKLIISGSSVTELSIQSIKYLVGRIFVFHLYPFSFEEYLNLKEPLLYKEIYKKQSNFTPEIILKIFPYFKEFCIFGGYPRVLITEDKEEKIIVLKNIYNTYFLKEIKEVLNLPADHRLTKVFQYISINMGNTINFAELSEFSGFSYDEVINYVNILEKTFILIRSRPYYTNKNTELVKSPKIFFFDNGLRNIVVNNFNDVSNRSDKGNLYENFVASEIIKAEREVKYWRTKSKAEVDFVIEEKGNFIPVEIKSNLITMKLTRSFHSFVEKYNSKIGFVLSEKLSGKKRNITFKPIFEIQKIIDNFELNEVPLE